MTQNEIINMAVKAGIAQVVAEVNIDIMEAFAKLVADKKEAEMQDRINTLHAMYEQACKQRDELMDQQRAAVAAMRGRMQ